MEERKKHFERPTTFHPPSLFNLTLLAVLFGILAGFLGYILAYHSNVVGFSNQIVGTNVNLNIEQPIVNVARKYQQSIAGVYKKHSPTLNTPNLYDQSEYLGAAVAVTSDGWLMTTDQVVKNASYDIILGNKVYDIKEIEIDDFTRIVFIKIEASNIQPVDFQLTDNLSVGERLFTNIESANSLDHFYQSASLVHDHYVVDKFLSTDQTDYYLKINQAQEDYPLLGAAYFNTKGDVLGMYYEFDNTQVLIPAEYLRQSVRHLLDNTPRVSLGINYIDALNNPNLSEQGNVVYNPSVRAIVLNSPAAKAGILVNDQIIAVNNDKVTTQRTLTSLIQDYRVGDKIILKIIRKGIEQDLEITL